MKTIPLTTAAIFATAVFTMLATAEDKAPAEPKLPPVEPIPEVVMPEKSPWNVRVEVLMVAMPQEMALDFLPELNDRARCEAAFIKILAAIKDKKATLTGYPMLETLDGNRAVAESNVEVRYPTEFFSPATPQKGYELAQTSKDKAVEAAADNAIPAVFETRNTGPMLEVAPIVLEKGDRITMQIAPSRTELLGFDSFYAKNPNGKVDKMDQPRFFTPKVTTNITVRSGEHRLIGVFKLTKPEGFIELFILQAVATPVK